MTPETMMALALRTRAELLAAAPIAHAARYLALRDRLIDHAAELLAAAPVPLGRSE
jgi:hypothetical protein